jgi:hypothetical protein
MDEKMGFDVAIRLLKDDVCVARMGWNGKGMFLFLVKGWTYTDGVHDNYTNLPFIAMKTVGHEAVPWLASQTDILADDWCVVEV